MNAPKRLSLGQATDAVRKKWIAHHATYLIAPEQPAAWPLSVTLHDLTERDVQGSMSATRDWVRGWREWTPPAGCSVQWTSRRWSSGDQELPTRLIVSNADAAARLLGLHTDWTRAQRRYAAWCERFPGFAASRTALRHCDSVLIDYSDDDFARLNDLLAWLLSNPASNLYLRQLPIPNVDTKWIERRKGHVGELARHLLGRPPELSFHDVCGLRIEPARLRIRILCPDLRTRLGGLRDIEAPTVEIASLPLHPRDCLIVENLNTGIALPDFPSTVAFMRLGLAVEPLSAIPWLGTSHRQIYWGDLDTHGFIALARARLRLPRLRSVLMDSDTLLAHRAMWVREERPSSVTALSGLTPAEHSVFDQLRTNAWSEQVRLEQERIHWPYALAALRDALADAE